MGVTIVIEVLVEEGAKIEEENDNGQTALHYAARRGDKGVVEHASK